ncbi:MAG: BrnA antitoxin family protein [Acidithiobacillus sp.]
MKVRYFPGDGKVLDADSGQVVASRTDWERVDALQDSEIDYDDIPDLGPEFWAQAQVVDHGRKKPITIRVDQDVLEWFKSRGGRYQVLMNQVLRQYMKSVEKHRSGD